MPDNLPSAKKPVIQKTPPTTIEVPAPPYTPTPPKKPAKEVCGVIGSAVPVRVIIRPTPSRGTRVEWGQGLSGTSPLDLAVEGRSADGEREAGVGGIPASSPTRTALRYEPDGPCDPEFP